MGYLEGFAKLMLVATFVVGFFEAGIGLGSVSDIVSKAVSQPTTWGVGLVAFFVGFDVLTPAIHMSILPSYLRWLCFLYPNMGGEFVPSFSIWSLLFSLIAAIIVTFVALHILDWEFWWHGFATSLLTFVLAWYIFTAWLSWFLLYWGASQMGLSSAQAWQIWHGSAEASTSTPLQYLLLFSSLVSSSWVGKKLLGAVV